MEDGFRLITLGRLSLQTTDGREDPSLAARRLKLVLLAVLASSRRPLSRDALLALFWPDQDEARARHSLSDALSHLRRVMGAGAISTRQTEVALTAQATLAIDAAEFVAGIESTNPKHFERALGLYEGPFLDGVNLSASQQLDEWIARERARLEALFVRACERRCAELARAGAWEECGVLAARWVDAVPLSTEAAVHRLRALNAPGTRDAAQRTIAEYRRMVARLRDDYGRGPDARVVEIVKGLREQLGGVDAEEAESALAAPSEAAPSEEAPSVEAPSVEAPSVEAPSVETESGGEIEEAHPAGNDVVGSKRWLSSALAAAKTEHVRSRAPSTWKRPTLYIALAGALVFAARVYHRRQRDVAARNTGAKLVPSPSAGDVASGNERLLIADLANHTRDSLLPGAITEALRVDLEQSRRVQVLSAPQVQEALRRMERTPALPLSDSIAREVALRDGAKAVVTGDVGELGTAYTISVHLVSSQSGEIVDAFRETARDSTQVLDAVDRLSRQLRTRLGDGLALIRGSAPLEQVTTPSLAALRAYSQGVRAAERDGETEKSITLLEEAVSLDPHFAMAYRKLAAELDLLGSARHAKALEATESAYRNRDHLSDRERYLTMAIYYQNIGEPEKTAAAYRAVLEQYPLDIHALNNLGSVYMQLKDFKSAEALRRRAIAVDSSIPVLYNSLAQALFSEGKYDETARVIDDAKSKFPDFAPVMWTDISLSAARGDFKAASEKTNAASVRAGDDYDDRLEAQELTSALALAQGQPDESARVTGALLELIERKNQPSDYLDQSAYLAFIDTWYRHAPARALARLDAALVRHPLASIPVADRHSEWLAYNYAIAGKPARARAILAQLEAAHPQLGIGDRGQIERAQGAIELAEHRFADAQSTLRKAQDDYWCPVCALPDLGRAYDLGGVPDSAIAVYTRYVTTSWVWWLQSDGEYHAWTYRRLGELYEMRADTVHAVDAYTHAMTLWSRADGSMQSEVAAIRARLAALGAKAE